MHTIAGEGGVFRSWKWGVPILWILVISDCPKFTLRRSKFACKKSVTAALY